jgi:hypothetical protein
VKKRAKKKKYNSQSRTKKKENYEGNNIQKMKPIHKIRSLNALATRHTCGEHRCMVNVIVTSFSQLQSAQSAIKY